MDAPAELQREQIATLLTEAQFLLDAATQKPMKEEVLCATSDLDEGLMWLQQPGVNARPEILHIVDLRILAAARRLEMVREALEKYGPDATTLG